jgi:UDP-N-acetylmuramate: L-alanyl-gamma-D-glutamyl-meso-diaminopimelate ligase
VVEGDEYDTAYFDKGPKFLHYHPRTAIFTSCELDHADIYCDQAHYQAAFERFVALLPGDGFLAACASYQSVLRLARQARCRVETYAVDVPGADWEARGLRLAADGARFTLVRNGAALAEVHLPVGGAHNVENALGVAAAATALGLSPAEIAAGLQAFGGVKRRQEVRGRAGGVTVMDDFAHHPRAVEKTLAAVAGSFPGARRLACFEPRSNTSRSSLHQRDYADPATWSGAAGVFLLRPAPTDRVPPAERLDVDAVCAALEAGGTPAAVFASVEALVAAVVAAARPGDVVVVMSNGAFGGVWDLLLAALEPGR